MKKLLLLVAAIICCGMYASAAISVTPASGGTNICANMALGGSTPGFTSLGTITVTEGLNADITAGFPRVLVINAPAGWQFNTAVTPTLAFTAGRNIFAITNGGFTATSLTINLFLGATTQIDIFTISGLQVRANSGASAAGNITASTFAGFAGVNGATNFGSLSLTPSLVPSVALAVAPSAAVCAGTTASFTATPTNGGSPTYQWNLNGVPVVGATNTTFNTAAFADGDVISVIMGATGCVAPTFATANRTMTINPTPAAVTVSGAGTYCERDTIVAGPPAGGTIYYQGTNFNGTSTAAPSTTQVVTGAGSFTYYFRERSTAGCWGVASPVKVRINMPPSAIAVTPSSATFCMGDSATFIASGTAPNVEVLEEDFNAGLGAWTVTNLAGTAASFWQSMTPPGHASATVGDGTLYAQSAPDATGAGVVTHSILTSPSFSLAGFASATLRFNQFYRYWATGDTDVNVEYSIDGGSSWVTIVNQVGGNVGVSAWTPVTPTTTIVLPPAVMGQPNVMLRWDYNSLWGFYWSIDNVKVNAVPSDLAFNWAGVSGAAGLSCSTCDTVMITPAVAGFNTYTVTSSVLGCTAGTSLTLTVNPQPVAHSVTGGGNYCIGGAGLPVGISGSDMGINYQLYNGATTIGFPIPGSGSAFSFGTQTMAGTYTVMATDGTTGCNAIMNDSAVIVIDTLPSAITGPTDICIGSTVTLASTTPGGTWSSSDIAVATIGSSTGDADGVSVGTADITYTAATSCFITQNVTVNPLPVIAPITGITKLCIGGSTTLSNATLGGMWLSADPSIASIDMLGGVNANAVGITTISYAVTDIMGCSDTVTAADTVIGLPAGVSILPLTPSVTMCEGNPVNLVLSGGSGYTYQWSQGGVDIAGATNSSYTATVAGTYELTIDNGTCSMMLPSKTVIDPPVASINYNTTGNYLYTGSFHAYQWFRNDAPIVGATSSVYMSPTGGNYKVVVYDINGCTDTSAIYTMPTTSVGHNNVAASVRVFPNPASTQIHIDAPVKVNVTVASPDGRTVKANQVTNTININDLPNGAYMLLIYDEHNMLLKTERFSKIN